jgi:DNA-binding response OmpR family regulator
MHRHELVEKILDTFAELGALHAATARAAERAWSLLAEYEMNNLHDIPCTHCHRRLLSSDRPLVNTATFTVAWRDRHCIIGPSILFKLIERLSRHPDRFYSYHILMDEVWDGRRSNAAVRSAVKRLRRTLCAAGMSELAAAIKGRGECYGLFLNGATL